MPEPAAPEVSLPAADEAPDVAAAPDVIPPAADEAPDVAAAHPVGDILVQPAAPAPGRRLRPRMPHPRVPRPHMPHPHMPRPHMPRGVPHPHMPRPHMPHPHMPRIHVPRPAQVRTFESFRHRNYRFLWASSLFFSGAFWLQQVVIGWMAYDLTGSALLTSLAMGLDALPILIAGPIGGLLVDRWDKRKLLAGVFAYQALLALGFGAITLMGLVNAWHLFAFLFLMGMGWVIADPARMALIPGIVPRHSLVNAFALNSLAFSVSRLAVPALGGALLAFAGAGAAMLLEAAIVAVAVAAILWLRMDPAPAKPRLSASAALSELAAGARYIRENPLILGLLLFGFLPPVLALPFLTGLIPVYAAEVYGVGPAELGLLMSSVGGGFLVGTLILASIGDAGRKGMVIMGSIALMAASMAAFALNPSLALAYPLLAIGSAGTMGFFSVTGAAMQGALPDALRGRVSGIYIMTFGAMPLGSLAAGMIAESFGAPAATMIAAFVVAFAALALALKFPEIRRLD